MHAGPLRNMLMLGRGPVTTLPLLMFAAGVRRIPLSLVGMLQYINPTLQITIGVMLYREPFTRIQLVGFGLVWTARWPCLPSRGTSPGDGPNWPSLTYRDGVHPRPSCDIVNGCPPGQYSSGGRYGSQENGGSPD